MRVMERVRTRGSVAPAAGGRRPPRRLRLTASLVAVLHLSTACFTYAPPRTAPARGTPVRIELSDEGRVAHAAVIGPGVLRVDGTLRDAADGGYVVDVSSVTPIRGPALPVSDIRVSLGARDVGEVQVRTLSRRRTAITVGTALAIIVTFLATKGFRSGSTPPEGPPGDGGPDQYRGVGGVR